MALCAALQLASGATYVHTQPATAIAADRATLNGMLMANGLTMSAWFGWGVIGSYNHVTSAQDLSDPLNVLRVSAAIAGLSQGTTYQFRLVVTNASGTKHGPMQLFTTESKVSVWGNNIYGQVNVPPGLTNVCAITGGERHCLALRNDGTVIAWGDNTYGQLNVPGGLGDVVAIASGRYHNLAIRRNGYALKADGTVISWSGTAGDRPVRPMA